MSRRTRIEALLLGSLALTACRGDLSEKPPVHLNPNMDKQARFMAQERNPLFGDERAMRPQVPGTVAVGELKADDHLYRGLVHGKPAKALPMPLTRALLARGRERFDIYCRVCHGGAGLGDGVAVQRGMVPPPSYLDARIKAMALGEIFHVISNGVRNMQPYAAQIPVRDRWAICAYVRALQVSRDARLEDVPADVSAAKGWKAK